MQDITGGIRVFSPPSSVFSKPPKPAPLRLYFLGRTNEQFSHPIVSYDVLHVGPHRLWVDLTRFLHLSLPHSLSQLSSSSFSPPPPPAPVEFHRPPRLNPRRDDRSLKFLTRLASKSTSTTRPEYPRVLLSRLHHPQTPTFHLSMLDYIGSFAES